MNNSDRNASILLLFRQGLTYGQIGTRIGVSRNVVSGVLSRFRAKGVEKEVNHQKSVKKQKEVSYNPPDVEMEPAMEDDPSDGIEWPENESGCMYELHGREFVPVEDFRFCGEETLEGAPFCEKHFRVCYYAKPVAGYDPKITEYLTQMTKRDRIEAQE